MREHLHWHNPPSSLITCVHILMTPPPSPLSANVITECPRTSTQLFSYKIFCTNLSKVKLEILWNSSAISRRMSLKILQYSEKNTCVGVSFSIKLQAIKPVTLLTRESNADIFLWISQNFWEHLFWTTFRSSHQRCFRFSSKSS